MEEIQFEFVNIAMQITNIFTKANYNREAANSIYFHMGNYNRKA